VARGLLVVATAGLLPPAFVGHSAAAADHETAVASVSVHMVAAALWVGGLAVLAVLVLADRRVCAEAAMPTVAAFSTLALGCVLVVAASGVLNAALRVGPGDLLGSTYGLLLLAKTAGLVVLVALGWWHRRRSIAAMANDGGRAAFVRLVVVELAVMALVVAVAVVLARTPPPGVPGG
jgi:putative copper resistance protein D